MRTPMLLILSLCLAACGLASQAEERGGQLTITISGTTGNSGKVLLAVYDDPEQFDNNGHAIAWLALPPSSRRVTLHGLPAGKLAVSAFHDANENQELDTVGGLPTEGYGSTGDVGRFKAPTFESAAFEGATANVQLYYLN